MKSITAFLKYMTFTFFSLKSVEYMMLSAMYTKLLATAENFSDLIWSNYENTATDMYRAAVIFTIYLSATDFHCWT